MRILLFSSILLLIYSCGNGNGTSDSTSDSSDSVSPSSDSTSSSTDECLISNAQTSNAAYGEYVALEKLSSLDKETVAATFTQRSEALGNAITSGVHIYKISYNSMESSASSSTTQASGLLIIPYTACDGDVNQAPWAVVNHGTIIDNASAPTNNPSEGLFEGGLGFITLVPDYIGYGDSYNSDPSIRIHPYIIADAYATDGYAMMKASKQVLAANNIQLGNLYIKGYSEGGYAALALQKYLEANHSSEFPITASAPTAGPYSTLLMSETLTSTSGRQAPISPTLFGFIATSYWYNYSTTIGAVYSDFSDVFLKTDEYSPGTLFNGTKSYTVTDTTYAGFGITTMATLMTSSILDAMNAKVDGLGTNLGTNNISGVQTILLGIGSDEPMTTQLRVNDLIFSTFGSYTVSIPTIFYHCSDDSTIPALITSSAYGLLGGGVNPNVFTNTSQTGGHSACAFSLTPTICFKEIEASLSASDSNTAVGYLTSPASGSACNN